MADRIIIVKIPEDIAVAMDRYIATLEKPQRIDPQTNARIIEKQFPDGLEDWIPELLALNFQNLLGATDPQVIAAQKQAETIALQTKERFRPKVDKKQKQGGGGQ